MARLSPAASTGSAPGRLAPLIPAPRQPGTASLARPGAGAGARGRLGRADRRSGGPGGPAWRSGSAGCPACGVTGSGTRPVTSMPKPARPPTFGRVVGEQRGPSARRGRRASARRSEYSRASAGRPSSRLASTVSAPVVLQLVGPQLGQQPDPAALVPAQVEHDPAALGGDRPPWPRPAGRRSRSAASRTRRRSGTPSASGPASASPSPRSP